MLRPIIKCEINVIILYFFRINNKKISKKETKNIKKWNLVYEMFSI